MTQIVLKIKGMECPNCAIKLEKMEDDLKGIITAEASYHKAQIMVEYDENEVTEEQIKVEIRRIGYEVAEVK